MNPTMTSVVPAGKECSPTRYLVERCQSESTGLVQVFCNQVQWCVFLDRGAIVYANISTKPFDRLYSHLRRISNQVPALTHTFCLEVAKRFGTAGDPEQRQEYTAIVWLRREEILVGQQATALAKSLTLEALESLLLTESGQCNFLAQEIADYPHFCYLDYQELLEYGNVRTLRWQALGGAQICTPYQRLYFVGGSDTGLLPPLSQQMRSMLKGYSFRDLAAALRCDELDLATQLSPYIRQKIVYLRDPVDPYVNLPKVRPGQSTPVVEKTASCEIYTIVCIDDSPSVTAEIERCLAGKGFRVMAIHDSLKALMQVIRLKPDIILMDVGMPALDGYGLCAMLRKHPSFKKLPIVMVTGNTGLINRARASISGATDYLTKPFKGDELLKVVQRHLPKRATET
jgi:two-component system, chemotaxis family, response regulator PixG